jgi:hypothetical protein
MSNWIPERLRNPLCRRRYNVRLYPQFPSRLRAVAAAYGLHIGEFVELAIMRAELDLKRNGRPLAAIGRELLRERNR